MVRNVSSAQQEAKSRTTRWRRLGNEFPPLVSQSRVEFWQASTDRAEKLLASCRALDFRTRTQVCFGDEVMLNLLGSEYRLCDGISRRDFLQIGSLGAT